MRFCNEKREQVKKENPGMYFTMIFLFSPIAIDLKLTEISKKFGEMWNELSEEEKKVGNLFLVWL